MLDLDGPWKEALDRYFPQFLACFFPKVHAKIDWTHEYEPLDGELRKLAGESETGSRRVDKLVKAKRLESDDFRLLHCEVQNHGEMHFEHRVHVYNYRIEDAKSLPPTSFVVLGDEDPAWRPKKYRYAEDGCERTLKWPIVKLLDYADKLDRIERGPHLFMRLVVAHLVGQRTRQDVPTRKTWKLRLLRGLLTRNLEGEDLRQWMRYIDWILVLPEAEEQDVTRQFQASAREEQMPYVTSWERRGIEKTVERGLTLRFKEAGAVLFALLQQRQDAALVQSVADALMTGASQEDIQKLIAGS